ncbi:myocardin isoform X1 [Pangasianodon hypophthalmus]|uniref:myocardin isoform X1 n=1 Tax=Pangasianodon hypophthalmus TaxID=310915 RepID=UPI000EFFF4A0|nr:myocardin isoform X1 [Pangasianodon hypophthalmus]
MTLLASERSLLIRSKFRSVLQLRIQNRRQQKELNADSEGVKASCSDKVGEKEANSTGHQTVDGTTLKSPPSALTAETAQDKASCGAQRQKKARLVENVSEKIQRRSGSIELLQKHIAPLENTSVSFSLPSDVFEDDISSCSSASPEQLGTHQSPSFSSSPGLSSDQSLSDVSPVAMPINHSPSSVQQCSSAVHPGTEGITESMTMTVAGSNSMAMTGRPKGVYVPSQTSLLPKTAQCLTPPTHSILGGSLSSPRPPRPRKPRDCKPKMRKLKYHQYIPPDQRGNTGGTSGNNSQKNSNTQVQPVDPAYSRLLHQQQVFLQLQILNQQQQLTVATSENQVVTISGAGPQSCLQPAPPQTNTSHLETSSTHKLELLPPNLDDLTVSELRQQLRKRGLPVSGTKPALLERLRPFQMPRPQLTPAPLCQLEGTLVPSPPPNLSPSSSPSQIYIQPSAVVEEGLAGATYLTSPSSSAGSSPNLQAPSPPVPSSALWRSEQAAEELTVELEMRERIRSRPRGKALGAVTQTSGSSLHPFLQQDPGCARGKPDTEGQEVLFTQQVFSCQPCDTISQDFELPMQITASPEQAPPHTERSLEELLQEAIQRVQMDPRESIDDILEDPVSCSGNTITSELQSSITTLSGSSPASPPDQFQPTQPNSKDESGRSSPLCSSLLLELPPSPAHTLPLESNPAPPPPPLCTTPPLSAPSRKRRSDVPAFDAVDWLESLTSGLHPLTPPVAPFVESDFALDSDLNISRVLDLMVEQW